MKTIQIRALFFVNFQLSHVLVCGVFLKYSIILPLKSIIHYILFILLP